MADPKELAARLRKLATGRVVWRVADPVTGSYCMELDRQYEAEEWMIDNKSRFPNGIHANKVVTRVHVFDELERAALEAADALDPEGAAPGRETSGGTET